MMTQRRGVTVETAVPPIIKQIKHSNPREHFLNMYNIIYHDFEFRSEHQIRNAVHQLEAFARNSN